MDFYQALQLSPLALKKANQRSQNAKRKAFLSKGDSHAFFFTREFCDNFHFANYARFW